MTRALPVPVSGREDDALERPAVFFPAAGGVFFVFSAAAGEEDVLPAAGDFFLPGAAVFFPAPGAFFFSVAEEDAFLFTGASVFAGCFSGGERGAVRGAVPSFFAAFAIGAFSADPAARRVHLLRGAAGNLKGPVVEESVHDGVEQGSLHCGIFQCAEGHSLKYGPLGNFEGNLFSGDVAVYHPLRFGGEVSSFTVVKNAADKERIHQSVSEASIGSV